MRPLVPALLVALLAGSTAPTAQAPTLLRPTLADLGFMAGCWRGASEGGVAIDEYYTPPSQNLILGVSRYTKGGAGHQLRVRHHCRAGGFRSGPHAASGGAVARRLQPHQAAARNGGLEQPEARLPAGDQLPEAGI